MDRFRLQWAMISRDETGSSKEADQYRDGNDISAVMACRTSGGAA